MGRNNTAIRVLRKGESEEIALAAWIAHLGLFEPYLRRIVGRPSPRPRDRAKSRKNAAGIPLKALAVGANPTAGKEGHEASECLSWLRSSCGR
jgi:hypothetical protein